MAAQTEAERTPIFGLVERRAVAEGERRDEERHREPDAAEETDAEDRSPADPLRQPAKAQGASGRDGERDAERLAEQEAEEGAQAHRVGEAARRAADRHAGVERARTPA